jgi:protein SCO1/2
MRLLSLSALVLSCLLVASAAAQGGPDSQQLGSAAQVKPSYLAHAGIDQRLGQALPMATVWTDETGRSAPLGTWFNGKPVVLAEVYYRCAMLCPQVMHGLAAGLKQTTLTVGKDYNVLVFSIDPADSVNDAVSEKNDFLREAGWTGNAQANGAVHFLTGPQPSIDAVAGATGFHFVRVPGPDGKMDQFAHSSVVMFATPEGRVSRYLSGIDYQPRDLRMALLQASEKKISSPVDLLILYCCNYVPAAGKYTVSIVRVLGLAGMLSMVIVAGMIVLLTRKPKTA